MPTSAVLAAVVKQTSDSEPTHARVALKFPPTLATLYDAKYKNLLQSDFQEACGSVFRNLTASIDEAKYLEESTRLQSQSKLWFDHQAGRVTASKFAAVSKTSLSGITSIKCCIIT